MSDRFKQPQVVINTGASFPTTSYAQYEYWRNWNRLTILSRGTLCDVKAQTETDVPSFPCVCTRFLDPPIGSYESILVKSVRQSLRPNKVVIDTRTIRFF